ncbi:helix-turn-helix domain-containing protein [Lacrimispora sp. JR3]|uniref:helix-turn-helix domain-containing protein n=1 Tax=Lacrimispora sinapis TaxID=3111456 RepID=UPI00374797C1
MINDSGYYNTEERGAADMKYDILVNSAGHYRLVTQQCFETTRPYGRQDYQLLYVAKGRVYFQMEGKLHPVGEGHMVLYHPGDSQYYRYELIHQPEVYWVHFTGNQAETLLTQAGFGKSGIYRTGPQSEFVLLLQTMIQELQVKRSRYLPITNLYMKELIELTARYFSENENGRWSTTGFIEKAIVDFHQSYHLPLRISNYAKKYNVSCCWFIRCFKRYTGKTPQQYIMDIRMNKAKELLYSSSFGCNEIAQSIGYSDPLYFSRIFKQSVGVSPQEYRKRIRSQSDEIK